METRIKQTFDENPDYVPLSIKVIIVWFYLWAALNFLGTLSFREGGAIINFTAIISGFLAIWSAYHLGYKRNFARMTSFVLLGLWFVALLYAGWQVFRFWLEHNNHVPVLSLNFMGHEFTGITVILYVVLITAMNIYTLVILLQPKIKRLFVKPASALPTRKQEGHEG